MTPRALAVSGRGLVDPATAVLAADDEGFTRGRAAFETMRIYDSRPFRLKEHLDRLVGSARRVGLPVVDREDVESLVRLALEAAGLEDGTLRVFWTAGPPEGPPRALVQSWARSPLPRARHTGSEVRTLRPPEPGCWDTPPPPAVLHTE